MDRVQLTVYGHDYCSLCGVMLEALLPYQASLGFDVSWVDIEGDTTLEQRFGEWVPVLMAGEAKICHYHLDELALRQHFNQSRKSTSPEVS
ncbi:MAG: glutaredoxin family protein [Gammaproteobacteria bacterium]|nr:glutaredoxin family protein [Gammaproteobacteria bacterium]